MATYARSDGFVVARPEDLLYLDVDIVEDGVALTFPCQHIMEHPFAFALQHEGGYAIGAGDAWNWNNLRFTIATDEARAFIAEGGQILDWLASQWCASAGVEFPAMMYLEPFGRSRWNLHSQPRTGNGWTAVWQAELQRTEDEVVGLTGPLMRVARTQDENFEPAGFHVSPYEHFPKLRGALFEARLALSMLGASARIRGPHWLPGEEPGVPLPVKSYAHATQFGRDQEITMVERGYLSSGHPADLTFVTTRVFAQRQPTMGETYLAAQLFQTATLTVLEPEVSFDGIETPFRKLRFADEAISQVDPKTGPAYWVSRNQSDLHFSLVATDWEGREVALDMPLMFLRQDCTRDEAVRLFQSGQPARRQINLGGTRLALADRRGRPDIDPDGVTLPVHAITFDLVSAAVGQGNVLAPAKVQVALDAVARLTNGTGMASCRLAHRIDEAGNFLTIEDGLSVSFPAEQVGGVASPNVVLGAINAANGAVPTGPVSDVFSGSELLGVPLASLLADTQPTMPALKSTYDRDNSQVVTTYEWSPALDVDRTTEAVRLGGGSSLHLNATIVQSLDTGDIRRPPTSRVQGVLTNVTLSLLDVILVRFDRIEFLDLPNATPSITTQGVAVTFGGDLSFIDELATKIGGFPAGSPVQIDSAGITAGDSVAIPSIPIGVFSLANIRLVSELRIPFDGRPASVEFSFAERHAPFTLSVGIFGGGGFVAISATTRDLEVEASLEFGGTFEIDVVVARGRVFAMGGISFVRAGGSVTLEGYLRCGGYLEILDVVGVSVEFQLALGYDLDEGRIHGRATVTVGVQVLGFYESATFTVEKSFSTTEEQRIPQAQQLEPSAWDELCDAFV